MTAISQLPAEEILKAAEKERDRLANVYARNRELFGTAQAELHRFEGAAMACWAIKAAMQDRECLTERAE